MSLFKPSLSFTHLPSAEIPKSLINNTLGAIHFTEAGLASASSRLDIPHLRLAAQVLEGHELASELWCAEATPAKVMNHGHICYRTNTSYLFGVITLPELAHTAEATGLQLATERAYDEIFELMAALNYQYIYRFWNYISDINRFSHNLERYWQFNAGRKDAFNRHAITIGDQYPAACALGLAKGPLSIAFLLGSEIAPAPIAIENPRQVSAYEYPDQYGPRPPSFSRATLLKSSNTAILFISGTASIVGHETLHLNDPIAQTQETMVNLQTVLDQANQQLAKPLFELEALFLRVYVRNALDLPLIKQALQSYHDDSSKVIFILADICRQDLLLEIEATAQVEMSRLDVARDETRI